MSSTERDEHLERISHQGYRVIEDVIEPAHADSVAADLRRLERELVVEPARNDFEGRDTWRIYNLLAHGKLYEAIPVHPRVLPVVEGVLDEGCLVS